MAWSPSLPYEDLPPLPPDIEVETPTVLRAVIGARVALASFDALAKALPNPDLLLNPLSLLEAQASLEVENLVTTTDELFRAASFDPYAPAVAREAVRYREALWQGFSRLKTEGAISEELILGVCSDIRGEHTPVREDELVFIGNPVTRTRAYTPPVAPGSHLEKWVAFVNHPARLDPLITMALAHYQFEAIHPFSDGNGRTGRILNVLMLCASGLLANPVLYLSRHIIASKADYYARLSAVTSAADWEGWLLYLLHGVEQTAADMTAIVHQILAAGDELGQLIATQLGRQQNGLVAILMRQPYARISDVVANCQVSRPTASSWMNALAGPSGPLTKIKSGRTALFLNQPLIQVLRRSGPSGVSAVSGSADSRVT
ncbi:MAG: Fic family protein [Propionibacteriaceae bacterium]|jgi:Fic family protein|nr:Fic family protein [Propionibacteriaceae bacterium]